MSSLLRVTSRDLQKPEFLSVLCVGLLCLSCASADEQQWDEGVQPFGTRSQDAMQGDPPPPSAPLSVTLMDANRNPILSPSPNGQFLIRPAGMAPMFCVTLMGGAELIGGGTHRCTDSISSSNSDLRVAHFAIQTEGSGTCVTGYVAAGNGRGEEQPELRTDFSFGCFETYTCGYSKARRRLQRLESQ